MSNDGKAKLDMTNGNINKIEIENSKQVVGEVLKTITNIPKAAREDLCFEIMGKGEGRKFHPDGSLAEIDAAAIMVKVTRKE